MQVYTQKWKKAMARHFSALAWKIPWMEEPCRLWSMGSLRVGHDWATSFSLFTFMHWRRKWHPLQCSCLENPRDGGAWWAAVYGVTQSWTRLKRLSSSSSILRNQKFMKTHEYKPERTNGSWLYHFLALLLWACYITSPGLESAFANLN